jgi:hypothetical protein
MDLLDIPTDNRLGIVEKILLVSDILFKKEEGT